MYKVFAYVASGIVLGAGVFGSLAPRILAGTSTASPPSSPSQLAAPPYQAMARHMNSPQGQQMYQQCLGYMQQWRNGQPAN